MACLTQVAANYLIGQKEAKRWGTAHGSIVPYQVRRQQYRIRLLESAVLYYMSLRNDSLLKKKKTFSVFCHISLTLTRFCCSLQILCFAHFFIRRLVTGHLNGSKELAESE